MREMLFSFGLTTLISVSTFFVGLLINLRIGLFHPLLLLPLSVTLAAWFGGMKQGVFSLVLNSVMYIGYVYFSMTSFNSWTVLNPQNILSMIFLLLQGIFIAYLIDKAKKTDETNIYKTKVKEIANQLVKVQKEYQKAQSEIKARDEFLSIASHELKTPLTSMLLQIQRALHNIRNVSLAHFSVANLLKMLESTEQQTWRLSRMINDLLNVSLITTGKLNLEIEETNIVQVVKDITERLPLAMKREDYPIRIEAKKQIIGIWDKIRIEQAFVNLLSNAIKYGNNKPIEIKIENFRGVARIIIKDHGIGIPKEQQRRIFSRFERAVPKKEYQGLGVGLYITSQIIAAHNGTIKLDSTEGMGSVFTIELPLKNNMV